MKLCGIYNIISKIDGKIYIGSTNDFERRIRKHKCLLRKNRHDNAHLQNACNAGGMYGVFKGRLTQYKGWKKVNFEKLENIYN